MSGLVLVLAGIGSLVAILVVAGGVWSVLRSSTIEANYQRVRDEAEDYLRRVNFLEPRVEVLERENKTLRDLHNPAKAIDVAAHQVAKNHLQTFEVLTRIEKNLRDRT